jgi:hypothetical protein
MELNGLTEFQRNLLELSQRTLPRESYKIMRKIGSKARTQVAKKARQTIKKKTGRYHKKWKRGKVFKGHGGEYVVRVYNASKHAHLLEHGHRMVTEDGREIGFVQGKKPLEKGMREFESQDIATQMLSDWLDDLVRGGRL